jgi:hypothetical protein
LLKTLVRELTSNANQVSEISFDDNFVEMDTPNYAKLYDAISKAEEDSKSANQVVIKRYYDFGKSLEERYDHYQKNNPKRTAQAKVNDELRKQLPESITNNALKKRKERAQKIYELFHDIGVEKIERVKSFTAVALGKLNQEEIDHVLVQLAR